MGRFYLDLKSMVFLRLQRVTSYLLVSALSFEGEIPEHVRFKSLDD